MAKEVETKHWFQSKSLWGSIIVVAALVLRVLGKELYAKTIEAESGALTEWLLEAMSLVGAAIAIVGRIKATKKVTK